MELSLVDLLVADGLLAASLKHCPSPGHQTEGPRASLYYKTAGSLSRYFLKYN